MTDNWQPGDLALCVRGGPLEPGLPHDEWPKGGAIYQVIRAENCEFVKGIFFALWLKNGPINGDGSKVWDASCFRRIPPHIPDAEDAETIRLLNGEYV